MKIKHYDKFGNEFIKYNIIPNLKYLKEDPSLSQTVRKKLRYIHSQKYTCAICSKKAYYIGFYKHKELNTIMVDLYTKDGIAFNIDHIIPIAKGGSNMKTNKQCTCAECNTKKGVDLPIGFIAIVGNDGKFIPYEP